MSDTEGVSDYDTGIDLEPAHSDAADMEEDNDIDQVCSLAEGSEVLREGDEGLQEADAGLQEGDEDLLEGEKDLQYPEAVDAWDPSLEDPEAPDGNHTPQLSRERGNPQSNPEGTTDADNAQMQALRDMPLCVFPIARIKRIMNTDPAVKMISADALATIARATELFVGELAHAGYKEAVKMKKKTLSYAHLATASAAEESLCFLADILPQEKTAATRVRADFFRQAA